MKSKYKRSIWGKYSFNDFLGLIGIIVATIIIVLTFLYYSSENKKIVKLDEEFCPEKVPAVSVILIDQTDSFNIIQKTSIKNSVKDIVNGLTKYERLEIFILNPIEEKLLEPIFAICNPGQGQDENKYSGNKKLKKYNWKKNFYKPFAESLNRILSENTAKKSPIMEGIQSISVSSFHKYKGVPIRFYLFSDMLQHSQLYSNYKFNSDFNHFKSTTNYNKLFADLNDIEVTIFYINRETAAMQGKKHVLFWEKYFNNMGGILTTVNRVEG